MQQNENYFVKVTVMDSSGMTMDVMVPTVVLQLNYRKDYSSFPEFLKVMQQKIHHGKLFDASQFNNLKGWPIRTQLYDLIKDIPIAAFLVTYFDGPILKSKYADFYVEIATYLFENGVKFRMPFRNCLIEDQDWKKLVNLTVKPKK